jgi:uncharacterized protein YecE (DUF72 family)
MSTRYHIGAKGLRGGLAAYAKRFDLLEVVVAAHGKDASEPTIATLRRWRKQMKPHFSFTVVGGPHLSRAKPGPELERDVEVATEAIAALQARCFLLRTPPEVSPAAIWRDRLGKIFARFPKDATHVVWEPGGLWETGDAAVAARKWGVVVAVDASRDPVPAGGVAYARLRALGEARSFGEAALERMVQRIGVRRDVYVVIETDGALQECKRLRRVVQDAGEGDTGGLGRLVRPRGGILVRDDEQE